MDVDHNAALAYALDLWCRWLRNDSGELRKLWYPPRAAGLETRKSVTEDAWEDLEDEMEAKIVICVQTGMDNLTPAERACMYRSLGLCAVARVRDYQGQLESARAKLWRHLISQGAI